MGEHIKGMNLVVVCHGRKRNRKKIGEDKTSRGFIISIKQPNEQALLKLTTLKRNTTFRHSDWDSKFVIKTVEKKKDTPKWA